MRKAKINTYFGKEQEEWVVKYKYEKDSTEREQIFNEHLIPVFKRMIEAIMNRYKLYNMALTYDQTIDDCLSYVHDKLTLFDETRGFKAYSFLGTVAKRYMAAEKMKTERTKNFSTIEATDNSSEEIDDPSGYIPSTNEKLSTSLEEELDSRDRFNFIKNYLYVRREAICSSEKECMIFDSVLILMENPNDVAFYNKKLIYILIKEMTGIDDATAIASFIKKLKSYYFDAYKSYTNI